MKLLLPKADLTKAVVAIVVELSVETAVGAVGVPVSAGEALRTFEPVPVEDVTPVPPLATGSVPVTPGVMLAEPLNEAEAVLARFVWTVRAVVSVAAEPVVLWLSVGKSAAMAIE
jgi:hypothetical protein